MPSESKGAIYTYTLLFVFQAAPVHVKLYSFERERHSKNFPPLLA